ncbi:MAG TPA: hypothetical protein VE343_06325 [Streptosporangiaceae bacterium]|nr:hypothetical protein [Streptosporangiaceae bacterium]
MSVPLISSWESQTVPRIPPSHRIEDYATFFATTRSLDGEAPHLLDLPELSESERQAREGLLRELMSLRRDALHATGTGIDAAAPVPELEQQAWGELLQQFRILPQEILRALAVPRAHEIADALLSGPWHFPDGKRITMVCAQLATDLLEQMPYTDLDDPDYIELYTFADLDALFELHGHLRAANPASDVFRRSANDLDSDDYASHLVAVGGVDWNNATRAVLTRLQLPVQQVNKWEEPDGAYFQADKDGQQSRYLPKLDRSGKRSVLIEDVALFARAVNPWNRKRTVTICNGMYGRGSVGAVRALTDTNFRDRNAEYLRERFGDSEAYCLLTRVTVEAGSTLTPDWTQPDTVLFEWSR